MSKGFMFRMGVSLKDIAERLYRVPVLSLLSRPLKCLGLAIRSKALEAKSEK
jgi:hypothetical protein